MINMELLVEKLIPIILILVIILFCAIYRVILLNKNISNKLAIKENIQIAINPGDLLDSESKAVENEISKIKFKIMVWRSIVALCGLLLFLIIGWFGLIFFLLLIS